MPKPVIKVYLLPHNWTEQQYQALHADIVRAAKGIKVWGIKGEDDLITLFPTDLMKKGLGTEIHIEIDLPHEFTNPEARVDFLLLQNHISAAMVMAIHNTIELEKAYIQCKVYPFSVRNGFSSLN